MNKVNANPWPIHRPESRTIVLFGEELKVGMSVQVVGVTPPNPKAGTEIVTLVTKNRAKRKMIKTLQIPPTIHPTVPITQVGTPTATGTAGDQGGHSITATVEGRLSNETIDPTNLTTFATGRYILNSTVRPYEYGRALVTAIVVPITADYTG